MNATIAAVLAERRHPPAAALGQSPVDQLDAVNECRHGALPGDKHVTCLCWRKP